MAKTILSFYLDDTSPYDAPAAAFKTFLDFVSVEGIAGESSVILGYQWDAHGLLSYPTTANQEAYIEQLQRAYTCGVDSHFELMTHAGLYDIDQALIPPGAIHEGLWMHEPAISVVQYEHYLEHIISDAARIGVHFTGLTQPGCGCEACVQRFHELRQEGVTEPNPNLWQALLNLAQKGRFRRPTVPVFIGNGGDQCAARLLAGEGDHGVYYLPPNLGDHFGLWLNDPRYVDADYYINARGDSGRIIDVVRAGAPYCIFFTHWQGFNPANGVGWGAFTQVVRRVQRFLKDQVVWMRPSDYTDHLHQSANTHHPAT